MKPEDFRKSLLPIGTKLGFYGDYNAPSAWGENKVLTATLSDYVVVKRRDLVLKNVRDNNFDSGVLTSREIPAVTPGIDPRSYYVGKRFLLLHRHPDGDWDSTDPNVHIFGISDLLDDLSQALIDGTWRDNATWLSAAAIIAIMTDGEKSEFGKLFEKYETI